MRISIFGDYSPKFGLNDVCRKGDLSIFESIVPFLKGSDLSIVNYESALRSANTAPIKKCGPALSTCKESIALLTSIGFDMVTLANNHTMDYGAEGLQLTIEELNAKGIDYVGAGKNIEEAEKTYFKTIGGKTLAIINCCEHEFSIASEDRYGANPLNPVRQFYAIKEARKRADYVVVIVHGGHEFYQLPSVRMQETYRYFIDCGADAVVNHHQHCFSGWEMHNGKPIVYGLGNFCFDRKEIQEPRSIWNEGYFVQLSMTKDGVNLTTHPYLQCCGSYKVQLLEDRTDFDKKISELNSIIADKKKLLKAQEEYYSSVEDDVLYFVHPFQSKYYFKAIQGGIIKDRLRGRRLLELRNLIDCESHRDKLSFILNKRING